MRIGREGVAPVEMLLAVGAALAVLWAAAIAVLYVVRPRDVGLSALVRVVPDVIRLVRRLLVDPRVPRRARISLVALLAWLASPIDLVPEFIPVLGPLDDVVVAVLVLRYVRRHVGDEGLRSRWSGTDEGFALLLTVLGRGAGARVDGVE